MNEIIIIIISILCTICVFVAGIFIGISMATAPFQEADEKTEIEDLYCFQCEIEMPVKEKNGCLYCKNCGLYHGKI